MKPGMEEPQKEQRRVRHKSNDSFPLLKCQSQEQRKNLIKSYFKRSRNVTQEVGNVSFWAGEFDSRSLREEQKSFQSTFALKSNKTKSEKKSGKNLFKSVFDAELKETQFNKLLICFGASSLFFSITIFLRLFSI
jgi:hypothetical protein